MAKAAKGDVLVIFGITGDLAKVMTFRSLYRLEARGLLDCPIVGVAVDDWSLDQLRDRARTSIEGAGEKIDAKVFDRLVERFSYVSGDFTDPATYEKVGAPGLKVQKRDGQVEPFDGDKLFHALQRVAAHRQNVREDDLHRVARDIEANLVALGQPAHLRRVPRERRTVLDPRPHGREVVQVGGPAHEAQRVGRGGETQGVGRHSRVSPRPS